MSNEFFSRLTGVAITAGGLALASYIRFSFPEKSLVHFLVIGVAAIICVFGIGIYEDAKVSQLSRSGKAEKDPSPSEAPAGHLSLR